MINKVKTGFGLWALVLVVLLLWPASGLAATFNVYVSSYVNQNTLVIEGHAWSNYVPVNSIYLKIYRDGSFLNSASSGGSSSIWLRDYSDARLLANGDHTCEARATFYPTSGGSSALTDTTTVNINFPPHGDHHRPWPGERGLRH